MALKLAYPLKKGTYRRVRGYKDHTFGWKGIDDGCKVGTPVYAVGSGYVSHRQKINTGGGWNFRLNLTKYPGHFYWYAHLSKLPTKRTYKSGELIAKSGATGGVTGPHLHHSLIRNGRDLNIDSTRVVQYTQPGDNQMADKKQIFKNVFITVKHRWPTNSEINAFLRSKEYRPYTYVQKKYLTPKLNKLWDKIESCRKQAKENLQQVKVAKSQLTTQLKHIKTLQGDVSVLSGKVDDLNTENSRLSKELEKCRQKATESPSEANQSTPRIGVLILKDIWRWIKKKVG